MLAKLGGKEENKWGNSKREEKKEKNLTWGLLLSVGERKRERERIRQIL